MISDLLSTAWDEVVRFAVSHGLTAVISIALGGTGVAALTKFLRKNPLGNADFKIASESTLVTFRPGPATDRFHVRVHREFNLKLKDGSKKGTYHFRAELKGNNVSGKWESGCEIVKNHTSVTLNYKDDDTVIESVACKISDLDSLRITLNSTEVITRGRGFYSLIIGNPKNETTIKWQLEGFALRPPNVRACASSEDFDLIILKSGIDQPIYESSHQVTYFFTWAEEMCA